MPPGTVVRTSNARHVQCLTQLSVLELWLQSGAGAQARCLDGVAAQEMVRPPVLPGDREGQMSRADNANLTGCPGLGDHLMKDPGYGRGSADLS